MLLVESIFSVLTRSRNWQTIDCHSRKMKKRLLLCFLCAIILFILMVSTDNDFIQHVSPIEIGDWNDITCYEEESASNGLPDFDPELGTFDKFSCFFFFLILRHRHQQK